MVRDVAAVFTGAVHGFASNVGLEQLYLRVLGQSRNHDRQLLAVEPVYASQRPQEFDQNDEVDDRFFAGGDYSLRGFKLDTAGPLEAGTSGQLFPTGGNALILGGAELRVDLGHHVGVAAFSEAGNVYRLISDIDFGDVRYTAGLGLRYKSALGPIRIDWGYKLNRRSGEDPYRFHFTVGHAF